MSPCGIPDDEQFSSDERARKIDPEYVLARRQLVQVALSLRGWTETQIEMFNYKQFENRRDV